MKTTLTKIIKILAIIIILPGCKKMETPANNNFYLKYSKSTNPGKYEYLYEKLPDSIPEILKIINSQLIHPANVSRFPGLKKTEREDKKYNSMEAILGELLKRNPAGLILDRKPGERLILACGHFARFFTSIMKYKKIPARVRVGFAKYIPCPLPGKHVDHWVSEIWDSKRNKWILVDPDLQLINISKNDFEPANRVWKKMLKNEIDPDNYGYYIWWGDGYIQKNLCHDFYACINEELIYWEGPNVFHKEYDELKDSEKELFSEIAELLDKPERNIEKLLKLKKERKELQDVR